VSTHAHPTARSANESGAYIAQVVCIPIKLRAQCRSPPPRPDSDHRGVLCNTCSASSMLAEGSPREHAPATAGSSSRDRAAALRMAGGGKNFSRELTAQSSIADNSPATPSAGEGRKRALPAALSSSAPAVPAPRSRVASSNSVTPETEVAHQGLQFLQRRPESAWGSTGSFSTIAASRHPSRSNKLTNACPIVPRALFPPDQKWQRAESESFRHMIRGSAMEFWGRREANLSSKMDSRQAPPMPPAELTSFHSCRTSPNRAGETRSVPKPLPESRVHAEDCPQQQMGRLNLRKGRRAQLLRLPDATQVLRFGKGGKGCWD